MGGNELLGIGLVLENPQNPKMEDDFATNHHEVTLAEDDDARKYVSATAGKSCGVYPHRIASQRQYFV
jgi:hypothetical protein